MRNRGVDERLSGDSWRWAYVARRVDLAFVRGFFGALVERVVFVATGGVEICRCRMALGFTGV